MTLNELRADARRLLEVVRKGNSADTADNILVFLNRVRDTFPNAAGAWVHDLAAGLEAHPDVTMSDPGQRQRIVAFLEDCAAGRFPPVRSGQRRLA